MYKYKSYFFICLKLSFTPILKISSNFDILLARKSEFVGPLSNVNVKRAYFDQKI